MITLLPQITDTGLKGDNGMDNEGVLWDSDKRINLYVAQDAFAEGFSYLTSTTHDFNYHLAIQGSADMAYYLAVFLLGTIAHKAKELKYWQIAWAEVELLAKQLGAVVPTVNEAAA